MNAARCGELLARRCQPEAVGRWDVRSRLAHFALGNYTLPKERLTPHIPQERFEIAEFEIGGSRQAMVSAVPFLDLDFHFPRLAPFAKFRFAQTNYRVYVNDRRTGEPAVWFFGTTLGSRTVAIPRLLWRLPWHFARYRVDCKHDAAAGRYDAFHITADSQWAPAEIELERHRRAGRSLRRLPQPRGSCARPHAPRGWLLPPDGRAVRPLLGLARVDAPHGRAPAAAVVRAVRAAEPAFARRNESTALGLPVPRSGVPDSPAASGIAMTTKASPTSPKTAATG